jgi:Na+/H+ antiporter NhaA
MPLISALGACSYLHLFSWHFAMGQKPSGGQGTPTATGIAFSLAVLSLLGRSVLLVLRIFIISIFMATLAFAEPSSQLTAKLAVINASVCSGFLGISIFHLQTGKAGNMLLPCKQ